MDIWPKDELGFFSCLDEEENDKGIVGVKWRGGGSWRWVGWKQDHFDIASSDIHNA